MGFEVSPSCSDGEDAVVIINYCGNEDCHDGNLVKCPSEFVGRARREKGMRHGWRPKTGNRDRRYFFRARRRRASLLRRSRAVSGRMVPSGSSTNVSASRANIFSIDGADIFR